MHLNKNQVILKQRKKWNNWDFKLHLNYLKIEMGVKFKKRETPTYTEHDNNLYVVDMYIVFWYTHYLNF